MCSCETCPRIPLGASHENEKVDFCQSRLFFWLIRISVKKETFLLKTKKDVKATIKKSTFSSTNLPFPKMEVGRRKSRLFLCSTGVKVD